MTTVHRKIASHTIVSLYEKLRNCKKTKQKSSSTVKILTEKVDTAKTGLAGRGAIYTPTVCVHSRTQSSFWSQHYHNTISGAASVHPCKGL